MAIGLIGKWSGLLFDIGRLLVALFDLLLTATTNLGADRGKSNARRRDIGQDEVSCTCRDVHDRGGRRNRCRNPTEQRAIGYSAPEWRPLGDARGRRAGRSSLGQAREETAVAGDGGTELQRPEGGPDDGLVGRHHRLAYAALSSSPTGSTWV